MSASFPKPLLLLDVKDEGTDSIADVEGVDVYDIVELQDIEDAYWYLKENPKKYKTVVIDTVTQWQEMKIEAVSEGKTSRKGKLAGEWGTMTKQDWGDVSRYLKSWITDYRDLAKEGIEVVFIAQDRVFNADDEGEADGQINPEVGPRLSPATQSHLCAAVSVIGATFVRSKVVTHKKKVKVNGKLKEKVTHEDVVEYCLRLGPNQSYITKFRKPKSTDLPHFVTDPTYSSVMELIKGESDGS